MTFYQYDIDTKFGQMLAIANESKICLLEFKNSKNLQQKLTKYFAFEMQKSSTEVIEKLQDELNRYFDGNLREFSTPIELRGSAFQNKVWKELLKIKFGQKTTYRELATLCDMPKSYRAVANANAANMLALIVPCHRVIASDGSLGGYAGGVEIKSKLIELEHKANEALAPISS